ncbi:MAG: septum formation protein Maf [Armatimonadetes bacterium]|nr:septum formation protein Maf [Armatimonadota bacterium]
MEAKYPVVLASGSPRRKELLARILESFEVLPSTFDESRMTAGPDVLAAVLAEAKARDVFSHRPHSLVIGCDTIVVLGNELLGKPADEHDARCMLGRLSGRVHEVTTGVFLIWPSGEHSFQETTRIAFRMITPAEIENYVDSGEPMDKAGAYAIQGEATNFATDIEGDFDNVVGLPVDRLRTEFNLLDLALP